jgi:nicotinamidase-related amidase
MRRTKTEEKHMKRALIVIDVQNEYVTGNVPIEYPSLEVSLPNIGAAMDAATRAGIPVVVVQHVSPEASPIFARGSYGVAVHESVAQRAFDHSVEKALPSSFAGTDLDAWLAAREIDTITIVGYMTQHCDESTARDAMHRGLAVEFLSDATGTLDMANEAGALTAKDLHNAVLAVMQSGFAAVATTEEWIAAIDGGPALVRSNIVASLRPAS